MSDEYADWDGAYVMGALSRAERQEYEAHLTTCDGCARAVAELGPLPGLLGRLAPQDAELLLEPAADPPASVATPRVMPLPWWRRTTGRVALGLAAAALVATAVAVPLALSGGGHPDETLVLAPTIPSPLSASVGLTTTSWGTRVDMTCRYAGYHGRQRAYALYVVGRDGRAEVVSRWHAAPGDIARTEGSTWLPVADIARVELRAPDGTVLLTAPA